ncbi:MAG: amidohydrolase [Bacteroidales bacterium]|nr:amidohydrolase [Bacteroidales bacterium]
MILLKDITLDGRVVDMLIENGKICKIQPGIESGTLQGWGAGVQVMDCRGKAAIPGFINMHTHAAMSLMRGIMEDVPFHTWLANIWKIEEKIDPDFVYWGTKVACLEMIKGGTTTFNDMYFFSDAARQAAEEMGLRPFISYAAIDQYQKEETGRQMDLCRELYEKSLSWKGGAQLVMAFHAVYSVSPELMVWTSDFAREHGLRLHIHLSETEKENRDCMAAHKGLSPTEYLDELGILGPHIIAAHSLWLSGNDIRLLGENHVNCVHNINSNAKLSSGYKFKYNELRDAGANVCLGTDGAGSSNNHDMLETMKTSALFQKAWRDDPAQMPLGELMDMATVNGAKALGIDAGVLREGAVADLSIVDTDNSYFLSPAPFTANLVFSAHSDCFDSVICGGRFIMKNRIVENEETILFYAKEVLKKII